MGTKKKDSIAGLQNWIGRKKAQKTQKMREKSRRGESEGGVAFPSEILRLLCLFAAKLLELNEKGPQLWLKSL